MDPNPRYTPGIPTLPFKSVVAPPKTSVIRSKQLAVRHQIASAEC